MQNFCFDVLKYENFYQPDYSDGSSTADPGDKAARVLGRAIMLSTHFWTSFIS